ncbi:MAG: NAD(P)/FAD-dependent oxidoreductase [Solirubrobacteraceae bacterium]
MRVAVIGTGISGLTAAYLLHRSHDVTVFESDARIGGHTHTVSFDTGARAVELDTGFIVFNDRNYPNFERLMTRIGVPWQPSDMSFSVSDGRDFEYASTSPAGLFANPKHLLSPGFLRMLSEIPRFQHAARDLTTGGDQQISLRAWLAAHGFSTSFVERLLVPQVSAVWSADPRQLWSMPAAFVARFFDNHGMLSLRGRPRWRTIAGGSRQYVERLTSGYRERIRVSAPVEAITRKADVVEVKVRGQQPQRFDQVVIATHSDQALKLLADASWREREILSLIPYQENEVVLHTDVSLLPRRRSAWASWNYHLTNEPRERTNVTYHLNRLQQLDDERQFCVTLNLGERINPERVIKRINYAHPVYTPEGVAAQARFQEISGPAGRTHFCGAYWGWGFHEDGVRSALRVAESFGVTL